MTQPLTAVPMVMPRLPKEMERLLAKTGGAVPAYNTVYLAYEPSRIPADRVKIMRDLLRIQHL